MHRKISRFMTGHILVCAAIIWGLFWIIAPNFPIEQVQITVVALVFSVATGIMWIYWPGIWDIVMGRRALEEGHILVLGIFVAWASLNFRNIWGWFYIYSGKPQYLIDSLWPPFTLYVTFTAGCLHLAAKEAAHGIIPRKNWRNMGIAIAVAFGLAFVIMGLTTKHHTTTVTTGSTTTWQTDDLRAGKSPQRSTSFSKTKSTE